jgi:signal peptidase I
MESSSNTFTASRASEVVRSWLPFAWLVVLLLAARWTLVEPYVVPSGSMEPTLKTGDRLYALKCAYDVRLPFTDITLFRVSEVKRGDVILFRNPRNPSITFVKRALAVAGDRFAMRDGRVFLNGEEVPKEAQSDRSLLYDIEFANDKTLYIENLNGVRHWVILDDMRPQNRDFPLGSPGDEVVVPEGHLIAVGDNRDNSSDSRSWGFVPVENLKGRAMFIWFSSANWRLRPERIGTLIH